MTLNKNSNNNISLDGGNAADDGDGDEDDDDDSVIISGIFSINYLSLLRNGHISFANIIAVSNNRNRSPSSYQHPLTLKS